MSQDDSSGGTVNQTISAVAELAKVVPIYPDLVQPAAKELGKSLETIAKTVNIALTPLSLVVWWYEQIEEFINTRVSEKLKNVPVENIVEPSLLIAWPVAEALRFAGHDENLRELYANLLATAMNKETIAQAHPWFVEMLKNITSDEALLLSAFIFKQSYPLLDIKRITNGESGYMIITSNYSHFSKTITFTAQDLVPSYIDNLCRLGVLEVPNWKFLSAPNTYESLENDPDIIELKTNTEKDNTIFTIEFERKVVSTTNFWKLFIENVVVSKS